MQLLVDLLSFTWNAAWRTTAPAELGIPEPARRRLSTGRCLPPANFLAPAHRRHAP